MVFGVKPVYIKMAQRFTPGRYNSRMDTLRDIADQIMSRSHNIFSRNDSRSTSKVYVMRLQNKWTSRKARVISVVLFAIAVMFCATVIGLYYMYLYHPRTDRLFKKPH